jgi:hypothetical protein
MDTFPTQEHRVTQARRNVFIIVLAVALAVLGGGYYYYFYRFQSHADIRKFVGDLVSVSDSYITLRGVFYDPGGKLSGNLVSPREFRFRTDEKTIWWSEYIMYPDLKDLKPGEASTYFIDDLPKKEGPGSLSDLAEAQKTGSVYIEAEFPYSILAARDPVAASVIYRVKVEPAPPPPSQ